MYWDAVEGHSRQITSSVKGQWAKAVDGNMLAIGGRHKRSTGQLQASCHTAIHHNEAHGQARAQG